MISAELQGGKSSNSVPAVPKQQQQQQNHNSTELSPPAPSSILQSSFDVNPLDQVAKRGPTSEASGSVKESSKSSRKKLKTDHLVLPVSDVRTKYPRIFESIYNGCYKSFAVRQFRKMCLEDCVMVVRSQHNPFGADYMEIHGIESMVEYIDTFIESVPDCIFSITETKFYRKPKYQSMVISSYTINGRAIYSIEAMEAAEDDEDISGAISGLLGLGEKVTEVTEKSSIASIAGAGADAGVSYGSIRATSAAGGAPTVVLKSEASPLSATATAVRVTHKPPALDRESSESSFSSKSDGDDAFRGGFNKTTNNNNNNNNNNNHMNNNSDNNSHSNINNNIDNNSHSNTKTGCFNSGFSSNIGTTMNTYPNENITNSNKNTTSTDKNNINNYKFDYASRFSKTGTSLFYPVEEEEVDIDEAATVADLCLNGELGNAKIGAASSSPNAAPTSAQSLEIDAHYAANAEDAEVTAAFQQPQHLATFSCSSKSGKSNSGGATSMDVQSAQSYGQSLGEPSITTTCTTGSSTTTTTTTNNNNNNNNIVGREAATASPTLSVEQHIRDFHINSSHEGSVADDLSTSQGGESLFGGGGSFISGASGFSVGSDRIPAIAVNPRAALMVQQRASLRNSGTEYHTAASSSVMNSSHGTGTSSESERDLGGGGDGDAGSNSASVASISVQSLPVTNSNLTMSKGSGRQSNSNSSASGRHSKDRAYLHHLKAGGGGRYACHPITSASSVSSRHSGIGGGGDAASVTSAQTTNSVSEIETAAKAMAAAAECKLEKVFPGPVQNVMIARKGSKFTLHSKILPGRQTYRSKGTLTLYVNADKMVRRVELSSSFDVSMHRAKEGGVAST